MLKRLLLPATVALFGLGAALSLPSPANAHWAATPAAATHGQAQNASDVVEVGRRDRHRHRHHSNRGHRHWQHWHARPYFYTPYAFQSPRCGYVWSHRLYRHVWRCW